MQDAYICGAVLAFILLDVISGFVAALKNNEVSSSVMREGLFKKCGSIMLVIAAVAVEHIGTYVGMDDSITVAIVLSVGALIVIMELTSVLENICKLNPDIPIAKVFDLFGISTSHDDEIQTLEFNCPYLNGRAVEDTKGDDDFAVSD